MFDDLYSQLVKRVNYKILLFLPLVFSALLMFVIAAFWVPMGIEFSGGTKVDVVPENDLDSGAIDSLVAALVPLELKELKVGAGRDVLSGKQKIIIETTSQIDQERFRPILTEYVGELYDIDSATVYLDMRPAADVNDRIAERFNADVSFNESSGVLLVSGFDLDSEELGSALQFYFGEEVSFDFREKNINVEPVGEILGKTFRDEGLKAAFIAYVLMIVVILVAFRDPIPSLAVILAGTCDAIIALGGMSIFAIKLDPSSLVALMMLVGYSVDSDILLTSRVLKNKTGTVEERINDAMKTGLTMTGTTLVVMLIIIFVSTFVFQIDVLARIASVILLGLLGDTTTTWFMNAGILKWYVEERGGKFNIKKSLLRR